MKSTVPWAVQPSGRRARKAKFAANAKKMRRWYAAHKTEMLASGRFLLPPQTMDEKYGDGSKHLVCPDCGYCIPCGDCKSVGCCDAPNGRANLEPEA